jgi:hypothetical protein
MATTNRERSTTEERVPTKRGTSTNPSAIRKRMRTAAAHLEGDREKLAEVQRMKYKPVEEWDLEELARGKPRNEDGSFSGARPKWITPLIKEEVQKRMREETLLQFDVQAANAVRVLVAFLGNDEEPRLRFEAAKLILEYVVGKPEQKVKFEGNVKLEAMLAEAIVLPDGEEAHPMILPGEIVEDDDAPEL